ncbi:MAG TPA: iron-containing alcohol dehydrogenase [Verrucomicrobiae bacterium]|nr:iron-containing alcohol dehydrogenase [Verrucomicrobiae bacterium]
MNPITLLQPPCVTFGNGCASQSAAFLTERRAGRVLLVTSKSVRPQIEFLAEALRKAGATLMESRFVSPEPTRKFLETVLTEARAQEPDAVLGVGGGSVLDVAKLLAALLPARQSLDEILGVHRLRSRGLLLVCLPTTAGTGSEVSPNAILLDEADEMKKGVVSPHLVPDAAFIDPLLTLSVPPEVTAATGLDALTHCIEAYANQLAHPVTDHLALRGVELISNNLLRAVRNGRDQEARGALALGSFYGGLCLGPVNTAAVHALAYPLGGKFRVPHGVANAVLLPEVLKFNLPAAPERYAAIAVAAGVARNGSLFKTAEQGIEQLANLARQCGVPQRLSELKIPRAAIPAMARAALQVQRLLKNNPRPVTEADAANIYEAIW